MTRSQLITKVANDTGLTATAVEKVMDGIFGTIGDVLRNGEKVTIAGFGRFEMRERQTKNFTNPKTKVTSQLQPHRHPGLQGQRPPEGKGLQVNGGAPPPRLTTTANKPRPLRPGPFCARGLQILREVV